MTLADFLNELSLHGLESFKKYYSSYEGLVCDNADPEKLGRLKVVVPTITGAEVTDWIYGKGINAGAQSGIVNLPKKGDAVWITCQNGDPLYMLWEYGWGFKGGIDKNFTSYAEGLAIYNKGYRVDITDSAVTLSKESVKINLTDTTIELNDGNTSVKVVDGKISVGSIGLEPAVMGDKLDTFLGAFLDAVAAITVLVAGVPQPIINAPAFAALKLTLETLKSQTVKISS